MLETLNQAIPQPPVATTPRLLTASLWLITALSAFWGPLDLSGSGALSVGLDPTVLLKLAIAGSAFVLGIIGVLRSPQVRQLAFSWPALLILAIATLACVSSPRAISSSSLPIALINTGYLFFISTCLVYLSLPTLCMAILSSVTVFAFASLGLYFLKPDMGVFHESLPGGMVVNRLGGLAHPNASSRQLMVGFLLSQYLWRCGRIKFTQASFLTVLMLVAAYLAMSRTGLIAGFVAAGVLWADVFLSRRGAAMLITGLICVVGFGGLLAVTGTMDDLGDRAVQKISKTGDTEELTSGTGRTQIWSYVIEQVAERPLMGHGFNSGPTLLAEFSQSTHNAVLNIALSTGILGGIMMIILLLWNLLNTLTCQQMLIRSLCIFIVLNCLAEDTIFQTFPGPCTMLWLMCCLTPLMPTDQNLKSETRRTTDQAEI